MSQWRQDMVWRYRHRYNILIQGLYGGPVRVGRNRSGDSIFILNCQRGQAPIR